MEIEIKSVTFKATVDGKQIERTVTPDEKGMPGIFRDVFNSIRFYLLHNPNPLPNQPGARYKATKRTMDGGQL